MLVGRRGIGLLAAGLLASAIVVIAPSAAHADGDPCAPGPDVTTYTAADSNHLVGDIGAATGQCIVIDASLGPVVLDFGADDAISLAGGSIETINTSAVNTVTLQPEAGSTTWAGIESPPEQRGVTPAISAEVSLSNTTVVGAGIDVVAKAFAATDDTIGGALCDQTDYLDQGDYSGGSIDVDGTTVTSGAACTYGGPVVSLVSVGPYSPVAFTNSTVNVTSAGIGGVSLTASSGSTTAGAPSGSELDVQAHGDQVNGVRLDEPAMQISGDFANDATSGVGGNTGSNDSIAAEDWVNVDSVGDLDWPAMPAPNSASAPLGLMGDVTVYTGSVTVDPNTDVDAVTLDVPDGSVDATVGPTFFVGDVKAEAVTLDGAQVSGSVTVDQQDSALDSTISDSYISGRVAVTASSPDDTPLTVTGSAITGGVQTEAPDSDAVAVSDTTLSGSSDWGLFGGGPAASLSCDVITGNSGGVETANGGSSILLSDIYDNVTPSVPDLQSDATGGPVNATTDWWGQATGPATGQVTGSATTTPALAAPSTCAALAPAAPTAVTDLSLTAGDGSITATWTNPTDPTFTGNVVRIREGDAAPDSPDVGTLVYSGKGTTATMSGLAAGTVYSITVFSSESDAVGSGIVEVSGSPRSPLPVTDLAAAPGYYNATLTWTPSADPGTTTLICDSDFNAPVSPSTCPPFYSGSGSSATLTTLYYENTYVVWAIDSAGNVSSSTSVTVYSSSVGIAISSAGNPTATKGQRFEIDGGITGAATSGNATFAVFQLTGASGFKRISTFTQPAVGFRTYVHPKVATKYFVAFEPTATVSGSVSSVVTAIPNRWIALHPPKPVKRNHRRTLRGKVLPDTGLKSVAIRTYAIDFVGRLVGRAKVKKGGYFSLIVKPNKKGVTGYIAEVPKSAQFAASSSNVVMLRAK